LDDLPFSALIAWTLLCLIPLTLGGFVLGQVKPDLNQLLSEAGKHPGQLLKQSRHVYLMASIVLLQMGSVALLWWGFGFAVLRCNAAIGRFFDRGRPLNWRARAIRAHRLSRPGKRVARRDYPRVRRR